MADNNEIEETFTDPVANLLLLEILKIPKEDFLIMILNYLPMNSKRNHTSFTM